MIRIIQKSITGHNVIISEFASDKMYLSSHAGKKFFDDNRAICALESDVDGIASQPFIGAMYFISACISCKKPALTCDNSNGNMFANTCKEYIKADNLETVSMENLLDSQSDN